MSGSVAGNAAKGLPALVGVLWGILIHVQGAHAFWQPVAVLAILLMVRLIARWSLGWFPMLSWLLFELWIASAISVIALGTAGILWLTIYLPNHLGGEKAEIDAVSGAVTGAVTAYLAALWTKDIEEAEGTFWPSTQLKAALTARFDSVANRLPQSVRDAIYEERVPQGPTGWAFAARFQRMRTLQRRRQEWRDITSS